MFNLAILSPNRNAYSETFIQHHKLLPFNVKFYYNGFLPCELEPYGYLDVLVEKNLFSKLSLRERKLRASFKKEKISCVLAEYGMTAAESLPTIRSLGLPLIVHFHGYDASVKSLLDSYIERYIQVFDYAKYIVAVSNKMRDVLIAMGCPTHKIVVSRCGVNETFFNIPLESKKKKQFIAIGRFVEKKAPHLTIAAFLPVLKFYPDSNLVFAGDGPLLEYCKSLVSEQKISNIEFLGAVSSKRVKELFAESIAFVQHSVTAVNGDSEGTPVSVMEASAAGLPVISTNHGGIPEVVLHGITGLLVNEFDVPQMTLEMLKMLTVPQLAQKMGRGGRKNIKENYKLSDHLKALENLIISNAQELAPEQNILTHSEMESILKCELTHVFLSVFGEDQIDEDECLMLAIYLHMIYLKVEYGDIHEWSKNILTIESMISQALASINEEVGQDAEFRVMNDNSSIFEDLICDVFGEEEKRPTWIIDWESFCRNNLSNSQKGFYLFSLTENIRSFFGISHVYIKLALKITLRMIPND